MERRYFEINEAEARRAWEMMSMRDYPEGNKTAEYRASVDEVYDIADKVAERRPEAAGKAYALAERYARKLADNYNADSRIGCMCPSILISGSGNFPVRKKEKQVAAMDRNMKEYEEIQKIPGKIKDILYARDIIKSGDEDAIERLEKKLEELKSMQELMRNVNAYWRKHKNLDECPYLTPRQRQELTETMYSDTPRMGSTPFLPWQLSNNNQNIHSVEQRLANLKAAKEAGTKEQQGDGFRVVENTEIMRLQIIFDDKPEADVREVLKANGFRWAPSAGAWQRQLTPNARHALKSVLDKISIDKDTET